MCIEKLIFEINGTPLIKFQSEDRIRQLQKGHIYAKTIAYYRELEKKTGDNEIGDKYEAMLHVNQGHMIINETGEIIQLSDSLITTGNSNDYAFCMFAIYPHLESFEFSEKQKEKMLSFGDTALIVLDYEAFKNRVFKAAKDKNIDVHFSAVRYYNPDDDVGNIYVSLLNGMWNIAFWKRDSYRYQQEGRFVFAPNESGIDHIELEIGDISDITKIVPATSALTALVNRK